MTTLTDFLELFIGAPVDPIQSILAYMFLLMLGLVLFIGIIDIFYTIGRGFFGGGS